jgi:transposase-like protein
MAVTSMKSVWVEVMAKAMRRKFSAEYKLEVLREADACTKPGEIGALLRREGLYTSHLSAWRKQRRQGELGGLTPKKRGPLPKEKNPLAAKVAALEKETVRLKARAERAEALVELQKKVSEILGIELKRNGEKS